MKCHELRNLFDLVVVNIRPIMHTFQSTRSSHSRSRRATTAFRSACDWLCCTSSTRNDVEPPQQTDPQRSIRAAYEVGNTTPITLSRPIDGSITNNTGSRSPANSGKNGRKISPISRDDINSLENTGIRKEFGETPINSERLDRLSPTSSAQSSSRELGRRVVVNHRSTHVCATSSSLSEHSRKPSATTSVDIPIATTPQKFHKFSLTETGSQSSRISVASPRSARPFDVNSTLINGPTLRNEQPNTKKPSVSLFVNSWSPRTEGTSSVDDTSTIETLDVENDSLNTYGWLLFDQQLSPNSGFVAHLLRCAQENPEFLKFQRSFINWIRSQTQCFGCAFILRSSENNLAVCRISEDQQLFADGFYCCGHDHLVEALGLKSNVTGSETDRGGTQGPKTLDIRELDQDISSDLFYLAEQIHRQLGTDKRKTPERKDIEASLCGITTSSGFVTTLIIVHQSKEKREQELKALLPHMDMIGSLTASVYNLEEQRRLSHLSQMILDRTHRVLLNMQDMNLLVRNITKEAKTLVSAEICSLFLLDRENKELVAEVFEKDGTSDEYLTEIRMPLSEGIVGHVARTGEMMNVADVYKHPNFYPNVDQKTGFVTRNVLCFPIKDSSGNLVGVAELCNKIDKPAFTRHDEQVAQTFAVYCAISISHCLLYRKLQEAHRRSHMAAELLVQGSTLSIAPEDILRLTVREIPPPESFHPDFNLFRFFPRSIGTGDIYVEAALSMFQELGLIDRFRIRRRTLARFLLMVQKGYREVPYHNWGHAFAVAHFCYLLLRLPTVQKALDELERLSLLVACLCHDIDHRGTTNSFQLQSKTPLAQLYSSEGSVLERHHFAQTVTILGMDECNIFDELSRQEYQTVLDNMREIILATDLVAHLRKVHRINKMVEIGFDNNSTEHHYLFMCLLMTASDLSDQTKDFKNSKIIADHIYKEFFSQGDLEKQMGNEPSEMMDREKACVPKIQLEFTDSVTTRVFSCISQILPELRETYESVLENRRCWSALDAILLEEGVSAGGGLDYLRNTSIEQKVYERVKTSGKKPVENENSKPKKDTETNETNNVNKGSSSSRTVI
ncbi:hypothetical protein M3Y96_00805700 [Aphelenchoides besseyi]|nr:hypothetical protein M3Y96_00805700 [Aphelenchoides besseyi]